MEAGEYGLPRGTCFIAGRLEVVAVAGLWILWCVLGAAGFVSCFPCLILHFQIRAHDLWLRETQRSQRRRGEGATTASQSTHRELALTDPHQAYHLLYSHLRVMASGHQ